MAGSTLMRQVKVTCKKETFDIIESIDKKQRNKLGKLVDRYIFTVETLFDEEVSENIEQWEIDHPNIIGKNVAKNIKNCAKHNYNCYLCYTNPNYPGDKMLSVCSNKFMGNGEYEIGDRFNKLIVDSNNKVTYI